MPRLATLLGVVLFASTLVAADASGASAGEAERESGRAAPTGRGTSRRAPPSDSGSKPTRKDPDQELIDHLEEIERLELLQNLELFDSGGRTRSR